MEHQAKHLIARALDNFDFITASFLCERLFAHKPSSENLFLLARTYYAAGKSNRCYELLKPSCVDGLKLAAPKNRLLFATCCYELEKLVEAEAALCGSRSNYSLNNMPNGAAGYRLLALICRRSERRHEAVKYLWKSLELDPHLWSSVQCLCDLGEDVNVDTLFAVDSQSQKQAELKAELDAFSPIPTCNYSPVETSVARKTPLLPTTKINTSALLPSYSSPPLRTGSSNTPPPPPVAHKKRKVRSHNQNAIQSHPIFRESKQVLRRHRHSRRVAVAASSSTLSLSSSSSSSSSSRQPSFAIPASLSFSSSSPSSNSNFLPMAIPNSQNFQGVLTPRTPKRKTERTPGSGQLQSDDTLSYYTSLLRTLANGYKLLQRYNCTAAIDKFQELPSNQYNTGWVLCQVGTAYHRIDKNHEAIAAFEEMRKVAPYRTGGLEIYSTALWHLRKEVELSHLAQCVTEFDRFCPETWIVVGNCFSLQKEHESAIKYFQRAIRLDSTLPYAHALLAHEYVMNEDFDKALMGFRRAIRCDDRHYVAWYGLGNIYNRQENYSLAEIHYKKSFQINGQSSVLCCHIGTVMHKQERNDEALQWLNRSASLTPNVLAIYQKGLLYAEMGERQKALATLKKASMMAPLEASVHHEIGKICRDMNDFSSALVSFDIALGLDPEDKHQIKSDIEKLGKPQGDNGSGDESSVFRKLEFSGCN